MCVGVKAAQRVYILDKTPVEGRFDERFAKPEQYKSTLKTLSVFTVATITQPSDNSLSTQKHFPSFHIH